MTKGIVFGAAVLALAGTAQPVTAQEVGRLLGGQPVSADVLAEARGGTLTGIDADFAALSAELANVSSSISGTFSASNSIAADAFQNAAGAFTVIQNNGNNAIIQVNTILSVIVQ